MSNEIKSYLGSTLVLDKLGRLIINDHKLLLKINGAIMDDFVPNGFVDIGCDSGCGQDAYCRNNVGCNDHCDW